MYVNDNLDHCLDKTLHKQKLLICTSIFDAYVRFLKKESSLLNMFLAKQP